MGLWLTSKTDWVFQHRLYLSSIQCTWSLQKYVLTNILFRYFVHRKHGLRGFSPLIKVFVYNFCYFVFYNYIAFYLFPLNGTLLYLYLFKDPPHKLLTDKSPCQWKKLYHTEQIIVQQTPPTVQNLHSWKQCYMQYRNSGQQSQRFTSGHRTCTYVYVLYRYI